MSDTREFLRSIGLPPGDLNELPDSPKRFPDGALYRIEIPSTEGPRCLEAVLEEAARLEVTVHRVSQGSGVLMLTDQELDETARLAAAARVLADLGADTINLPTDLTLAQIAAIRAAVDVPLDVYVEAPDNVGGFVRLHEIPELIRVAAPVYVKFGLRNAPDVYPAGTHLDATTVALSRERVRRARLGMELLARSGYEPATSALGAPGLAVPVLAAA